MLIIHSACKDAEYMLSTKLEIKYYCSGLLISRAGIQFQLPCFRESNASYIDIGRCCSSWVDCRIHYTSIAIHRNIYSNFCIFIKLVCKRRQFGKSSAAKPAANAHTAFAGAAIAAIAVRSRIAIGFSLVAVATGNALVFDTIV